LSDELVPLVLLPGLNCSPALWSYLDVGPAVTPILTEPTLDRQVNRLLDELPPRFALAGLSLGGIVAMALVRCAPERVSRLCLMSTTSRPPTGQQYAMWARQRAALATGATARDLQRELKAALLSPHAEARRRTWSRWPWPWLTTSEPQPWTRSWPCRRPGSTSARA
jgi:pimeloyl-ACP methyl ester carboxylesterase